MPHALELATHGSVDAQHAILLESAFQEEARTFDAADPLASLRAEFLRPMTAEGQPILHFAGHSLGLQPRQVRESVLEVLDDWAQLGVEGHFAARRPWLSYHELLTESTARLVGALPAEVVVMNTLTVNVHLMMVSFYRPMAKRKRILIESGAFPSDRYAVASQAQFHGLDPEIAVQELVPRPGEATLRDEDILATIARDGEEIALIVVMSIDAELVEKRGDLQVNSFDTATLDVASGDQPELVELPEAATAVQVDSEKSLMDSLPTPAEATLVVLPVSRLEGDARVRDLTDYGAIEYAQEMAEGAKFPPPEVRWRRDPDGRVHYTLVDGFHRLAAHAIRKKTTIECFLSPGDLRDAKWAAVGSNVTHGIRRSDADKRLAVWIGCGLRFLHATLGRTESLDR